MGVAWLLPLYDPLTRLLRLDRARRDLLVQANLQPRHRVLDIGCGTGSLAVLIKQLHPDVEVVGLDPDEKALARARRKARRAGVTIQFDLAFSDDLAYQNWRKVARSEAWQREFLARPLAERRHAIVDMREKSKEEVQAKPAEIMDVNDAAVAQALRAHAVTRLVHGHTHRPGRHALTIDGRPAERWVLPDWYGRGGYLEIGRGAPKLVRF